MAGSRAKTRAAGRRKAKRRSHTNRQATQPAFARAQARVRGGSRAIPRPDLLIPLLLAIAALALYLPRLSTPDFYDFDEGLHAFTAREYLAGNRDAYRWDLPCSIAGGSDKACVASDPDVMLRSEIVGDRPGRYEWTHPPLGIELIAGGMLLFGDGPVGRRIAAALFGAIGIALTYLLALKLTHRRIVGLLTAGLLLMDGLYFVQSRTGVLDIFGTVFMIGAFLAFAHYLTAPPDRARWPLLSTGALLGLSMAVKWNAVFPTALISFVALWRLVQVGQASRDGRADAAAVTGFRHHLIWVPVSLILVPLAIQIMVHIPFFLAGNGLADFFALQRERLAIRLPGLEPRTLNPEGTWSHAYASRWWQWPLALRPVWHSTVYKGDTVAVTYANGNPFLYWAFLPAVFWLCWHWWRTRPRSPALLVLVIGFFGQWLPWAFVAQTSFIYHFLPAVPFGCLAVAVAVAHLAQSPSVRRRAPAVGYVALVILAFAFFYPIYSLYALSDHSLDLRMWFSSWR